MASQRRGKDSKLSDQELSQKVNELEKYQKQEKQEKKKHEQQEKKEMVAKKKKVTREVQAATKEVRKKAMEMKKLEQNLTRLDQQEDVAMKKKERQIQASEENLSKLRAKFTATEQELAKKVEEAGRASGWLSHVTFAQGLLENGVEIETEIPADGGQAMLEDLKQQEAAQQAALADAQRLEEEEELEEVVIEEDPQARAELESMRAQCRRLQERNVRLQKEIEENRNIVQALEASRAASAAVAAAERRNEEQERKDAELRRRQPSAERAAAGLLGSQQSLQRRAPSSREDSLGQQAIRRAFSPETGLPQFQRSLSEFRLGMSSSTEGSMLPLSGRVLVKENSRSARPSRSPGGSPFLSPSFPCRPASPVCTGRYSPVQAVRYAAPPNISAVSDVHVYAAPSSSRAGSSSSGLRYCTFQGSAVPSASVQYAGYPPQQMSPGSQAASVAGKSPPALFRPCSLPQLPIAWDIGAGGFATSALAALGSPSTVASMTPAQSTTAGTGTTSREGSIRPSAAVTVVAAPARGTPTMPSPRMMRVASRPSSLSPAMREARPIDSKLETTPSSPNLGALLSTSASTPSGPKGWEPAPPENETAAHTQKDLARAHVPGRGFAHVVSKVRAQAYKEYRELLEGQL